MEGVIFMSKQDRHGARTTADLERKYNFGKSFAEVMGLANDARRSAEAAEKRFEGLDHEMIFKLLTNNGALQGLYRGDDGELYINASFLKSGIIDAAVVEVVNLIAERLKSIKGVQILDVDGAGIDLSYAGKAIASLNTIGGSSYLNMTEIDKTTGKNAKMVQIYNGSVTASCNEELFNGSIDQAIMGIDHEGKSYMDARRGNFREINGKKVSWKDNGDGTFTLIGA
jgi:hypothetical protein